VISQGPDANDFLTVQEIELTSAQTDSPVNVTPTDENVRLASAATSTLETPTLETAIPRTSCEITAQGFASKAAMIELTLNAPCLPNERVTVHHRGMMFTQTTTLDGTLKTTVPAMDENALVIFAFTNGDGAVTQVQVPELRQYSRTAIQWKGDAGFEMHAHEIGASYGETGHVWKDTPRDPNAVDEGLVFLTRLGNRDVAEGLMAEVYSVPKGMSEQSGIVDLCIEAEVTALNCGLEIEAQSLEVITGDVNSRDLTLAVPDCDATKLSSVE
tara:strand:- start:3855 stop:4670 length:816 start_codon:yes stop_codon:yes gene_type:complete